MATRLENLGYTVYRENEEYYYDGKRYVEESNEVLVALKL